MIKYLQTLNLSTTTVKLQVQAFKHHLKHFAIRPQSAFHVAGTNGKGSVSTKLGSVLEKGGLKVGMFTSPHLFSIRQRIKINDKPISMQQLDQLCKQIVQVNQRHQITMSFFEIMTTAALIHFNRNTHFNVFQVGLGGRLDSTNCLENSLPIVTSISLDHTELLGKTIDQISFQKAGIVRSGKPLILGPTCTSPVFQQICKKNNASLVRMPFRLYRNYDCQNSDIAKFAYLTAVDIGFAPKVSPEVLEAAISVRPECRMQQISRAELQKNFPNFQGELFLDVGHNPAAIERALKWFESRSVCVFNTSNKKDLQEMFRRLDGGSQEVYLVRGSHKRLYTLQNLQEHIPSEMKHKVKIIGDGRLKETLEWVLQTHQKSRVLVLGSFFLMRETRERLGVALEPEEQLDEVYKMVT